MNKNLDLIKILKDCPKGTKFYSPIIGECVLVEIDDSDIYSIVTSANFDTNIIARFTKEGKYYSGIECECVLFPSKDNRNWSTFKVPNKVPNELPKTWEEFCKNNPIKHNECWIHTDSSIMTIGFGKRERGDRNLLPNKETAEAMLALCQLIQLRDCYNEGWKPDWNDDDKYKYCIEVKKDEIISEGWYSVQRVLAFKTIELRDEFLNNFKNLLEIAKPLL